MKLLIKYVAKRYVKYVAFDFIDIFVINLRMTLKK